MGSNVSSSASQVPITHPALWDGVDMASRGDWLYQFDGGELDELGNAAASLTRRKSDFLSIDRDAFRLPGLGPRLAEMREEILHGRGFVQLRALPVDSLSQQEAALIFWGISRHLGDEVVSQNKHGHVLGHVRDLGQSVSNASERGPYSADRIPWHVDCCDIVGLLCLRPSLTGGESSIASSGLIYNRLLAERPDLVEALSRSLYRDRRDEIPPGKAPWYKLPVFNRADGVLSVSIEPTYITSAGRHFATEPNSSEQMEGIRRIQEIANAVRLDIAFKPGDMQFLHNHTVMHTRQAFTDSPDLHKRRHLLRIWLINHDGIPLADAYYERHGNRETVARPGGIVGPATTLTCPLDEFP